MSAFQRFLQDFAAGSNTLDVDSQDNQEYEDVECSHIYLSSELCTFSFISLTGNDLKLKAANLQTVYQSPRGGFQEGPLKNKSLKPTLKV